jgi:ATP-dependent Lhr-like helicase
VQALVDERRALSVTVAGERRLVAAEDAGRYRDALGIVPPARPAEAFLSAVPTRCRSWSRATHAATGRSPPRGRAPPGHGRVAGRGCAAAAGRAGPRLEGEFRPGGHGREWCDPDVLATLRRARSPACASRSSRRRPRRSRASWRSGTTSRCRARPRTRAAVPDALLDVVEQLQGAAFPASVLERDLLPARVPSYRPADLDLVCSAGEVVWVGVQPLGDRDGA